MPKLRSLFYGNAERFNIHFPFGFFILLDLKIFSEVIEILQESVNHAQLKNYSGLEMIYSLNLSIHTTPKKGMNYI